MPRGGPHNRKPTALKVLRGTDRPDRQPVNEPKPRPIAPEMPAALDRWAKRCWKYNAPILERLGLLTEADRDVFAAYCRAYGRYEKANRRLARVEREHPDDIDVIRKAEVSVEKAEHAMRLLAGEFGLTPAARGRLSVAPEVNDDDEAFFALPQRKARR